MSANYTQNYKLCQWVPSDKVLREDFNEDNAKLETALTAHQTAIEKAQTVADAAYCPSYHPMVMGTYSGNNSAVRSFPLGFRPRAVLLMPDSMTAPVSNDTYRGYRGGIVLDGKSFMRICPLSITSDGFQVYHETTGSFRREGNRSSVTYFYLAVR